MKPKKTLIFIFFIITTLLLSSCDLIKGNSAQDGIVETLSGMYVQLTMQSLELNRLETQVAMPKEPTQPCPEVNNPECPTPLPPECPTPLPPEPTRICPACPACVPTIVATPTPTEAPLGSISGSLNYPSEFIPAQRIVAFNTTTGYYYWVKTGENYGSYKITGLPAGWYKVVSYAQMGDGDVIAGYTVTVACNYTCGNDRSLKVFELKEGEHKTGIDPIDWFPPEGSDWPPEPKN
jgi:hypothetical protein